MFGFFKTLKKRFKGVAALETAITLPFILYVIFFSIELVRIGIAQSAVDAITKECTFQLMATGKTSNFDSIFQKYKPFGIDIGRFRYYVRIYSSIETMMNTDPYGGETIGWAGSDYKNPTVGQSPTLYAKGVNFALLSSHAYLNKYQTKLCGGVGSEVGDANRKSYLDTGQIPQGYVFVLTVAVNFPFSSPFVKSLFAGGSNTNRTGTNATYILWSRGSGMIN